MRKPTTIALLLLLGFYAIGYYFVYQFMLYQHSFASADQFYPGSTQHAQIAILKIPVYLPYLPQATDEEKTNGSVQIDGIWYRAVSKHLYRDTLYITCVKDLKRMTINQWFHDFLRFSFGNVTGPNNGHQDLYKSFFKEYLADACVCHVYSFQESTFYFPEREKIIATPILEQLTPPPKLSLWAC
ncbi:MAG: hypothetical protein K6T34_02700 [Thermoflavifilum sp.]|nr:hypothetical protein [Thermoflavifilum sp.]